MTGSIEVERLTAAKTAFGNERSADFKRVAESAPFTLRSLGLGTGVAALAARRGAHGQAISAMVARWLLHECPRAHYRQPPSPGGDDDAWVAALLDRLSGGSRTEYRAAQAEALAYLTWIKRLAQAFCRED